MTFHDLCFIHYFPGLENGLPQFRDFPWPGGILFKRKGPHTRNERRVPELIPALGSQPAGDRSHKPGGRLALLSVGPAVTSPAAEHHRRWPGTKLCCSMTEAHVCKQLAQGCTRQRGGRNSNPRPVYRTAVSLTTRPPSHTVQSWQWVTIYDPWPTWPISQLTRDRRDPWPTTTHQSLSQCDVYVS